MCPTLFVLGFVLASLDHPGATPAGLSVLLAGAVLAGLALWWRRHPPEYAHRAAALVIGILQLALVAQLLAIPNPVLATLQIVLAIGTAFFVLDLRWMISMQLLGITSWLLATGFVEPSQQWQIARYVTLAGYGAAVAFHLGRVSSTEQIRRLARESERREEEAHEATSALRKSEARLRNAQRIGHLGSFEWDIQRNELHWSDEHYRIFGWDPAEGSVDNARFLAAVVPSDRDRLTDAVAASLRAGAPVDLEYRFVRPDGEERVISGRAETLLDASGNPASHVGTSLDITEMHRVTDALRESEGRLMALLTAMDAERAVVVSRDGIVRSMLGEAPTETGRYGISASEVPGRSFNDFLSDESAERVRSAVEEVYQTGDRRELEVGADFPGGNFHFDVSLRALRARSGEIESVLAIVRDVTQRRDDALALRQAQRLESLGVLTGGIAHDFNNLLVGILGNAELALEQVGGDTRLYADLEEIVRASSRAADLTQELLTYAGSSVLEPAPVDLAALVEETAKLVQPALVPGVDLEIDPPLGNAWIEADATQIRQVVMNFITNAADAMAAEGGQVRVGVDTIEVDRASLDRCTIPGKGKAGEYCRIVVSDRGVGMDAATIEKIFDPFFTTKFQGRGLGLASTASTVRAHDGAIDVDSAPARGSTFTMLLPRVAPSTSGPAEAVVDREPGTERILIVDDEQLVRTAAGRILTSHGYEVVEAESGKKAVELVASGAGFDLALIDLTMPDMDGEQTFAALRETDPALAVVFMSGHSDEDMALHVSGKQRVSHISKPFRVQELRDAIGSLLADLDRPSR
ncbi:MAG: PAS domain-containing hybrid sensor histidine kinase/response regulator [Myxococcota bacterium]